MYCIKKSLATLYDFPLDHDDVIILVSEQFLMTVSLLY